MRKKTIIWIFWLVFALAACRPMQDVVSGTPSEPAAAGTGTVSGQVMIGPLAPVQRADEPDPTPSPEVYASWQVVVLGASGEKEVTRVDIAPDGTYRVVLPAGDYLLTGAPREGRSMMPQQRYPVHVDAGQSFTQDISLDTGIR